MLRKAMRVAVLGVLFIVLFSTTSFAFGYFSSGVKTEYMEVQQGRVALKRIDSSHCAIQAFQWTGLHTAHLELERQMNTAFHRRGAQHDTEQYALDNSLQEWLRAYENSMDDFLEESLWVSPGGFLVKQYGFVNQSTVPVYFRIEKPQLSMAGDSDRHLYTAVQAWLSWMGQREGSWANDSAGNCMLADPGSADNYLYLRNPIEPGQEFQITFVIYVLSQANTDAFHKRQAVLSTVSAELLQAQNNAVYLDDEWKHAAESGDFFIPHLGNND